RLVTTWRDVNDASRREFLAARAGDDVARDQARADYERAYTRRSTAGWLLGAAVALSMVDAYVDAHLIQFDADFGPDPALPDDASGARESAPAARLSFRWSF